VVVIAVEVFPVGRLVADGAPLPVVGEVVASTRLAVAFDPVAPRVSEEAVPPGCTRAVTGVLSPARTRPRSRRVRTSSA